MLYPNMIHIQQHFNTPGISDIRGGVQNELGKLNFSHLIQPGETVAITAGSRGVANIALLTKDLVLLNLVVFGLKVIVVLLDSAFFQPQGPDDILFSAPGAGEGPVFGRQAASWSFGERDRLHHLA